MDEAKHLGLLLGTSTLLGQQHCLDVGQDAALGDGNASQKLVQLLIVPECTRSRLFLKQEIANKWSTYQGIAMSPDGKL